MKIKCGLHRQGNCWHFKPNFRKYWSGQIWHFGFWRFYFSLDFRKNFVAEMLTERELAGMLSRKQDPKQP